MKADITADLHAPEKRFSGARFQSGRALAESDLNAMADIMDDTLSDLVRTLLCAAGSTDAGFSITAPAATSIAVPGVGTVDTADFNIAPGTFILGGRVVQMPNAQSFLAGQRDWLSQLLDPGELPPAPVEGRTDLVYLETVVQPVRAVEDRELQERALNTDTSTRLRPQGRVRVLPDVPDDCAIATTAMRTVLAGAGGAFSDDGTELLSNARLEVGFTANGPVTDPCAPRTEAGYMGAENQTLRVMLPEPGEFLWNYDHGGDYYRVQIDAATDQVQFLTEPRDPVLFPRSGQVIELLPWDVILPNREKAAAPLGHLGVLTGEYDPSTRRIAYDGSMPTAWQDWLNALSPAFEGVDDPNPRYFYARIWQAPEGGGTSQPTGPAVELTGTGIELRFSGTGLAGDSYTASFRPDEPSLVLPMSLARSGGAPPIGPRRFFAPLALLTWGPDGAGNLTGEVTDCRHSFRTLCRIQSCCTYQVGDGHVSFGDFNSVQAAVDALPVEGGEICLLPGRHEGVVNLEGRDNIVMHGCGRRSVLVAPTGTTDPVIRLSGANQIELRDFGIEADTRLAVFSAIRARNILMQSLRITVTGRAIAMLRGLNVHVKDCVIRTRELADPVEDLTLAIQGPLVYLQGSDQSITGCTLTADRSSTRNLVAHGGLAVGGNSRNVVIRDNTIRGGNGNGISLGSVVREREDDLEVTFPGWLVLDDDGCFNLHPPGTFRPGGSFRIPGAERIFSEGDIEQIEIRHNRIEDHGASGISVAHWFVAQEEDDDDDLDDIEIIDATIADNVIRRCMQLNLVSSLPIEAAFTSGYGGIALAAATDLQIENNDIRECGTEGRSNIVGIYVRFGSRLRITDNRIYDNGRQATLRDPLLVGTIGGIVVSHVEGQSDGFGTRLRQTPAVFVKGNTVISQEGRALELMGNGQMQVEGNAFTAHGNNSFFVLLLAFIAAVAGQGQTGPGIQGQLRSLLAQIAGSAVAILNTGINPNVGASRSKLTTGLPTSSLSNEPRAAEGQFAQGLVQFNDNLVVFDALSQAVTLSFCSIAIFSLDDIGMHDNQCVVDSGADLILINTLVIGASTRVQGNRFRERLVFRSENQIAPVSAATLGVLNATENNQGTNCFLRLGFKKPRLVTAAGNTSDDLFLDTNRHVLPEALCARYDLLSRAFGD